MANQEVRISYIAEISQLRKELAKLPGISDKEAKLMVNNLQAQIKKAERASKAAAKASTAAFDKFSNSMKNAKLIADGFGGAIGGVAGQIDKFIAAAGALGASGGAVGIAIAGIAALTAGAGLATGAIFKMVGAAEEARKRLEEVANVPPLPDETTQALDEWKQGALAAEVAGKRLMVLVGGELAKVFKDLPYVLAGAADIVSAFFESFDKVKEVAKDLWDMYRAVIAITTLGGSEVIIYAFGKGLRYLADEGREAYEAVRELNDEIEVTQEEMLKALGMVVDAQTEAQWAAEAEKKAREEAAEAKRKEAEETRRLAEEERKEAEAAREAEAQKRKVAAATEGLRDIQRQASAETLSESEKLKIAYDEQIEKIKELEEISGNKVEADKARASLTAQYKRQLIELDIEEYNTRMELAEQWRKAEEEAQQEVWSRLEDYSQKIQFFADMGFSALEGITNAFQESAQSSLDSNRDKIAALKEEEERLYEELEAADDKMTKQKLKNELAVIKEKKKAARKEIKETKKKLEDLWKMELALNLAKIPMDAAVGVTKSIAILGPPVPLNPVGTAGVAAVGMNAAIQTGILAAQKPPKFHSGGIVSDGPDEVLAVLRQNEAVLNQRAAQSLGKEGIDALNAGRGLDPITVQVVLDGRVIQEQVISTLKGGQGQRLIADLTGNAIGKRGI